MALIYTFSFDSRYVGYEATITDADGAEVTGSPVTLDAAGDGTISLTTLGHYRAAVFNTSGPFGDGYSVVDCVLDEAASIAAGGGGGSANETGEGPPTTDPTTVDPGYTYLDTASGCLYITTKFDTNDPEWNRLGGEIDGANTMQGIILGNGLAALGKTLPGANARQVVISDVDAYEDSGNGIRWVGHGGVDGAQSFNVVAGTGGMSLVVSNPSAPVTAWQAFSDGSSEFGGDIYADAKIVATGAIGFVGAAPADVDINDGQCFMYFDPTNGAAKIRFKGKSADGTVVAGNVALS